MFRSLKFLRNITVCSILLFTVNSAGQSIVVKDDTNLLNASEDFINRASSLLDQDTIFAYKKAEQAITDEVIEDSPPDIEPGIRFNDDSDMVPRPTTAAEAEPEVNAQPSTEGVAPAEPTPKDISPASTR